MANSMIELRLSDVDPPVPDPPRTIYRDVVNLPDPVKLGLTVRYFNFDSVTLYFQITGSGPGYTFQTVNLGSLAAGTDAFQNIDQLASRAKPGAGSFTAGEFDETIALTLKAYTDAGYSNLKWTYERNVSVHWIKSDDAAFTVDVLNNFDDGTVQGWEYEVNFTLTSFGVATDYVLSPPYSLKLQHRHSGSPADKEVIGTMKKSFTTPNRNKAYAILDIRLDRTSATNCGMKYLEILEDSIVLMHLGKVYDANTNDYIPLKKWVRIVVPLPKNVAIVFKITHHGWSKGDGVSHSFMQWLDDFKIISK